MKKFFSEFRAFISKGNVFDFAVGVVIGAAFTAIVTSLVVNIITPFIGMIFGGIDFSSLAIGSGDAAIKYGLFFESIINFLIIAFVIFLAVKAINKLRELNPNKAEAEAEECKATTEDLLIEIRDLLAENNKK